MAVEFNPTSKQADIGFAAVLVGVAAWAFFEAGNFPGFSGSYPKVLSALLALAAIVQVGRSLRRTEAADEPRLFINSGRFVLGAAVLVLYILSIDLLGYVIPSIVVGIGVPFFLGFRNLPLTIAITLGTLAFIILVFFVVLGRPLPPDVLDPVLEMLR